MGMRPEDARAGLGIVVDPPTISPRLRELADQARRDRESEALELRRRGYARPAPDPGAPGAVAEGRAEQPEIKRKKRRDPIDLISEESEQITLSERLGLVGGLVWCHPTNEGWRPGGLGGRAKAAGLRSGVPDILIFTPAPTDGRPTALELKRPGLRPKRPLPEGARPWAPSCFSEAQKAWLEDLEDLGWHSLVAYDADEALQQFVALGYEVG